jgi:hypothetical protein
LIVYYGIGVSSQWPTAIDAMSGMLGYVACPALFPSFLGANMATVKKPVTKRSGASPSADAIVLLTKDLDSAEFSYAAMASI